MALVRVLGDDSEPQIAVMPGDPAWEAGPGEVFHAIHPRASINGRGDLAFVGETRSQREEAVWRLDRTGLAQIVRVGDPIPHVPGTFFTDFETPLINDGQEIVFWGSGSDGAASYTSGLFLVTPSGGVSPVLLDGDLLDVGAEPREVASADWFHQWDGSWPNPRLNHRGDFVFGATFTDGSDAIVLGKIKRKKACGIGVELALLAPVLARLRRQRTGSKGRPGEALSDMPDGPYGQESTPITPGAQISRWTPSKPPKALPLRGPRNVGNPLIEASDWRNPS